MIGALTGQVLGWQPPVLLLDVQGVGYELHLPMNTPVQLDGSAQRFYTHMIVREDQMQLYAFADQATRDVFRTLLKINGVGAKMGLAILSTWSVSDLVAIVSQEDLKALTRIPGVGKKTAERLLVEMKHKLKQLGVEASADHAASTGGASLPLAENSVTLALQALESLGYKPAEAQKLLDQVPDSDALETPELIKAALRQAQQR